MEKYGIETTETSKSQKRVSLSNTNSEWQRVSSSRKYQRRVRDSSKKLGIYANPYNTDRLSSVQW